MKKKINPRFFITTILLVMIGVIICMCIYQEFLKDTTYTKVLVVKDKGESCVYSYQLATVVDSNGDSLDVLVSEYIMFNKKLPFKATLKQSSRFFETLGIIRTNIWEKEFWGNSIDVTVIEKTGSRNYRNEVYLSAITKSGIKIECSMDEKLFLTKKMPFSAKVIDKVEGCIGYGFVVVK